MLMYTLPFARATSMLQCSYAEFLKSCTLRTVDSVAFAVSRQQQQTTTGSPNIARCTVANTAECTAVTLSDACTGRAFDEWWEERRSVQQLIREWERGGLRKRGDDDDCIAKVLYS